MKNKNILLGITGGIAAYKSATLLRLLVKAGFEVQVVMSEAACHFIAPLTLETLSGQPVHVKMFASRTMSASRSPGVAHIDLADRASLFVIAPATADFLARSAAGRASDLISAVTLAFDGPILAAPAMNANMWKNPATKRNVHTLEADHGWHLVMPEEGELACGWTGPGRMAEPEAILAASQSLLPSDLEGRSIVVTAGPTVEDIDPVRFLSNRSTGKMGYAIARAAAQRGANTTLISGPTALDCPPGVRLVSVRSALEMQRETTAAAESNDAVIMAAAVADYRPLEKIDSKLKKEAENTPRTIELVQNPDILKGLGERYGKVGRPILVGFALETQNLLSAAKTKLRAKGAHIIVANLASDGLGGDENDVTIIDDKGHVEETGRLTKAHLAGQILDLVSKRLTLE